MKMNKKGDEMAEVVKGIIIALVIVICVGGIAWLIFKGGNAIEFIKGIFGRA